MEDYDV
jgi:hypothetical protein